MKDKKNKIKKSLFATISKWWALILLFLFIVYSGGKQSYINYLLKQKGRCTQAIVYNRELYGGKGNVDTRYRFVWNNKTYSGSSSSDDKYCRTNKWLLTGDDLVIGDTIIIVFLESNPKINRSNKVVEKDCDCDCE